jgi:hypothetical protein
MTVRISATTAARLETLQQALQQTPMSRHDMVTLLGVDLNAVDYCLKIASEDVFVARYERNAKGKPTPFYSWGHEPDAPRPIRRSKLELQREWRAKQPKKAKAPRPATRKPSNYDLKPRRDPAVAAFFGAAA